MTPTKRLLMDVKERLAKSTPGPWVSDHCGDVYSTTVKYKDEEMSVAMAYPCFTGFIATTRWAGDQQRANSEFVAHAPTDLTKLVAIVECLMEGVAAIDSGILPDGDHVEVSTTLFTTLLLERADQIAEGK